MNLEELAAETAVEYRDRLSDLSSPTLTEFILSALTTATEEMEGRWQKRIYDLLCERAKDLNINIDGCGCDSGDPLDVTVTEIHQVCNAFDDRMTQLRDENERLEQRVGEFQIASLIDVGGGPCNVEPRHVEEHVTELREELEEFRLRLKEQAAACNQLQQERDAALAELKKDEDDMAFYEAKIKELEEQLGQS